MFKYIQSPVHLHYTKVRYILNLYIYIYTYMYVRVYVCMCVCVSVRTHARMHECMYECLGVCVCLCVKRKAQSLATRTRSKHVITCVCVMCV